MDDNLKRELAIKLMQDNFILLELYKTQRLHFDTIIDQALNYPSGGNRWTAYEALKQQADLIAHRVAYEDLEHQVSQSNNEMALDDLRYQESALNYSLYHTALVSFVDYLLPQSVNQDEIPPRRLYVDEDAITAWYAHAHQILMSMIQQYMLPSPTPDTQMLLEKKITRDDETKNKS